MRWPRRGVRRGRGRPTRLLGRQAEPAGLAQKWDQVLDWSTRRSPSGSSAAKLNVSYNCLDRHVDDRARRTRPRSSGKASRATRATITYGELHREVCKFANVLKALGVEQGRPGRHLHADDPGGRSSPCWPAPASARSHSVVFGGFSAEALRGRINDARRKVVITADGGYRARQARCRSSTPSTRRSSSRPTVENVRRGQAHRRPCRHASRAATSGGTTSMAQAAADVPRAAGLRRRAPAVHPVHLRHDRQAQGHPAHHRRLPARRSATRTRTGLRPQADERRLLVHRRHRLGHRAQLHRLRPAGQRRHPGHVRGHARLPRHEGRFWEIVREVQVTILYTAPTAIRAFMKWGGQSRRSTTCRSLRLLGSVGEPINPEAWMWYREIIGGGPLPDRGHLVADRDRRDHDHPAARRDRDQAGLGAGCRCPASRADVVDDTGSRCRQVAAATWCSASRGRPCCAASGAIRSGTRTPTGAASAGSTSPATARSSTRTATSGCSAGSTT